MLYCSRLLSPWPIDGVAVGDEMWKTVPGTMSLKCISALRDGFIVVHGISCSCAMCTARSKTPYGNIKGEQAYRPSRLRPSGHMGVNRFLMSIPIMHWYASFGRYQVGRSLWWTQTAAASVRQWYDFNKASSFVTFDKASYFVTSDKASYFVTSVVNDQRELITT